MKKVNNSVTKTVTTVIYSNDREGVSAEVESSFVRSLAYLEDKDIVIVSLENGVYAYNDVPYEVYQEFLNSNSQGKFYNSFIKNTFSSCKIVF